MSKLKSYFFAAQIGACVKLGYSNKLTIEQQVKRLGAYSPAFTLHYWEVPNNPRVMKKYVKTVIIPHRVLPSPQTDLYWAKQYKYDDLRRSRIVLPGNFFVPHVSAHRLVLLSID